MNDPSIDTPAEPKLSTLGQGPTRANCHISTLHLRPHDFPLPVLSCQKLHLLPFSLSNTHISSLSGLSQSMYMQILRGGGRNCMVHAKNPLVDNRQRSSYGPHVRIIRTSTSSPSAATWGLQVSTAVSSQLFILENGFRSHDQLSFTNIHLTLANRLRQFKELLLVTLVIFDSMSAGINASSLWGARPLHRIRSSLLLREVSIPRSRRLAYRRCLQMIRAKFVGMNDMLRRKIAIRLTTYSIYSKSLAHVLHDDPKHAHVNVQELNEMSRICRRRLDMFMSLDLTAISQVMEKDSKEIEYLRNLYDTEEEVREEFQDALPALTHDWERFLYLQLISAMARSAREHGHAADQIMTELSPASRETDTQYQDSNNDLDMMDTTGDLEAQFDQMNLFTN